MEWWRLDLGRDARVIKWPYGIAANGALEYLHSTAFRLAVVFGANSYVMLSFSSKETGQRRGDAARHVVPWGSPLGLCVELCCC